MYQNYSSKLCIDVYHFVPKENRELDILIIIT